MSREYDKIYPVYGNFLIEKMKNLELLITAMESFNALLEYGDTNVNGLPAGLVIKILIQLDKVDMKKLVSCEEDRVRE